MAWLVLLFLLYGDARSRIYLVPGSVYPTSLCQKTIWLLWLADADGRNRTRAASAARDRAIHCTSIEPHSWTEDKTNEFKAQGTL